MKQEMMNLRGLAGRRIQHERSRTLTQTDNTWYTLLTLNTANHFDSARAAASGRTLMMNSTLTLAVAAGILSREFGSDVARRMAIDEVRLVKTVVADDTLALESQVGEVEGEHLTVATSGRNQHGEAVVELQWRLPLGNASLSALVATAGETAPTLRSDRVFTPQIYAPAFEDFEVGTRHDHGTGRTFLRDESLWMSLLAMREGGAYQDCAKAKQLGLPDLLVDEFFVLATVLGLGVKHATQAAVANLGWRDIRFWHPVYPGDTIYAESETIGARLSDSRPGQGIISVRTTGRNHRDEVVTTFERSFLTYTRSGRPAEL